MISKIKAWIKRKYWQWRRVCIEIKIEKNYNMLSARCIKDYDDLVRKITIELARIMKDY